ncbi:MarR family winged helix-turn-helix transcriptional regulator [Nakamurella sp.]|uniref:MarR family winged helix-turn-helix transcriptional regulator n=1 Tax=Nakamurella sp. TaxID=1869182 RepID=UPI003784EED9
MIDPAGAPATERIPLARLFAIGYRVLVDGLHRRLAERGWTDVRVTYGFVLLAARSGELRGADVAALLGVSKQAASKLVDGLQEAGYVIRQPHANDERAKLIRLTERGVALLAVVEEIYAELEASWAALIGTDAVESLRADLTAVLERTHGGRLPVITPP